MKVEIAWKNRVSQLCLEKNVSVNKLSRSAGISQSTLQALLSGKTKYPTLRTTSAICNALGITIGEFYSTMDFDTSEL